MNNISVMLYASITNIPTLNIKTPSVLGIIGTGAAILKIAFLLTGGRYGGIERVFLVLANALSGHVKQIDLVFTDIEGEVYPRIPKGSGYNIVNLKTKRLRQALPALIKYLAREKPDYLISGSLTVNLYAAIAKILSSSRTRVIWGVHSILSELKGSGGITFRLLSLLSWLTYWAAYKVIAVSNFAAEDFSKTTGIPRTRIDVIYNPVPIEDITKESFARFEHRFFSTGHPPVIISVGRIEKEKNFLLLLEAFSIVRKHRDAKLLIVGEGSQRNMLIEKAKELKISEDVDISGFKSNPYPLMRGSSVFVLSSDHEACPMVLIEALALGLPIVATDCPGGVREILKDGKYGIISPKRNAKALADAIERSLDARRDESFLKERARDFSAEKISNQYLKLLGVLK